MPSVLSTPLRLYCERTQPGLFGEPLNTITSLAFLLAAVHLWRLWRHMGAQADMPEIGALILVTAAIGAGSAFFHSVATRGAVLFDVVPIAVFIGLYLYVFARDLLGLGCIASGALLLALLGVNLLYKAYVFRASDGYISYVPSFLFLLALSLRMLLMRHPSALRIALASGLAFLSLYFRMMDRRSCAWFPPGTHFLWHLFNALLIYILVRELLLHRAWQRRHRDHAASDDASSQR